MQGVIDMPRTKNLVGQRFNMLLVSSLNLENASGRAHWNCLCNCGQTTVVSTRNLTMNLTKSCGCLRGANLRTHGLSDEPEYRIYHHIVGRCTNPDDAAYRHYGARDITISARWLEGFQNFYADMGPRPGPEYSIDRIDNNKGYEVENCRWATVQEQVDNTRHNNYIEFQGKTMTLSQWARHLGMKRSTLNSRINILGMSIEKALTTPIGG